MKMCGEGERRASIVAKIMECEFTGSRKLAGFFILAFDGLQNWLTMFLQHSYLLRFIRVFPPSGPDSKCPSATERHLISIPLPPVDWRQVDTRRDA